MLRVAGLLASALVLAACSSGSGKPATTPTTRSTPLSVSVAGDTTSPPATSTSTTSTSTTLPATTTTTCPDAGGSTSPAHTSSSAATKLLQRIAVASVPCADRVEFSYLVKSGAPPSCDVAYANGPFSFDASGAPAAVSGAAFVVVRCSHTYGYDFETGKTIYNGGKRIEASFANHVRELVELGDDEGIVSWVIGLDEQRPFRTATTETPTRSNLVITFS